MLTDRQWTQEDWDLIAAGDPWLSTILANSRDIPQEKLQYLLRDTINFTHYLCYWLAPDPIEILATSDELLFDFIRGEYKEMPTRVEAMLSFIRKVPIP